VTCEDGHIFNPVEPEDDELSVTTVCECGEVTMTMATTDAEEYVHMTFRHARKDEPYHLAQFTMRID